MRRCLRYLRDALSLFYARGKLKRKGDERARMLDLAKGPRDCLNIKYRSMRAAVEKGCDI